MGQLPLSSFDASRIEASALGASRREQQQRAPAALGQEAHGRARLGRRGEGRRQLGRRAGRDEEVVDAPEPLALGGGHVLADQVLEVGTRAHRSSSRRSASRRRPLRVRVFTVPSGTFRYSDTSLWDSPPQYASSSTVRSVSGSSSSARSGSWAGGWLRARKRSTIACRATA